MPMQQASPDLLALVAVVCLKHLPNVLNDLARSQGLPQARLLPDRLRQIVGVKRLYQRFTQGHYEADENERSGLTALCDWLTDTAGVLSRNPRPTHAEWALEQFVGKTALPADAFAQLVEQVKAGRIG